MDSKPQSDASAADGDVDVLDLFLMLARHPGMVLGFPLAAVVVGMVLAFSLPGIFVSTARILPPQQSSLFTTALAGQITGGLSALAGTALGLKSPSDLYVGMLRGNTIADSIIARFNLKELYGETTLVKTRDELESNVSISASKDGIISIEFEDRDPNRAAAIANAYVEELDKLLQGIAVTDAAYRRRFFERHLALAKEKLSDAEVELRKTQERTGLIEPDSQGRAIIESIAQLRAQIALKEMQLSSVQQFATQKHPEYVRQQEELRELRAQLVKLEKSSIRGEGDVFIPTGKVPEAALEYLRGLRNVKYQEALYELLSKQFELAVAEEAKDVAVIQMIDRATADDYAVKPARALIVIGLALVAFLAGAGIAILWEAWNRGMSSPERVQRMLELKRLLRLPRG
jgi:uncharacterized protein involved in exopolysaccharide biosynthesis